MFFRLLLFIVFTPASFAFGNSLFDIDIAAFGKSRIESTNLTLDVPDHNVSIDDTWSYSKMLLHIKAEITTPLISYKAKYDIQFEGGDYFFDQFLYFGWEHFPFFGGGTFKRHNGYSSQKGERVVLYGILEAIKSHVEYGIDGSKNHRTSFDLRVSRLTTEYFFLEYAKKLREEGKRGSSLFAFFDSSPHHETYGTLYYAIELVTVENMVYTNTQTGQTITQNPDVGISGSAKRVGVKFSHKYYYNNFVFSLFGKLDRVFLEGTSTYEDVFMTYDNFEVSIDFLLHVRF